MTQRLLDVKDALSAKLEELCCDNLHTSEWKVLASIHDVLKPFAQYTSLVGVFSTAGESSGRKRNRLSNKHLE